MHLWLIIYHTAKVTILVRQQYAFGNKNAESMRQQTGLNPTEIMTDTAGSSDLIFGLFWLLGYQFSPRLADAGASVFWRVDRDADYGVLNDIASNAGNARKI